jgi:hypothetical protein
LDLDRDPVDYGELIPRVRRLREISLKLKELEKFAAEAMRLLWMRPTNAAMVALERNVSMTSRHLVS